MALSTTSLFSGVSFYQDASNTNDNYIFRFLSSASNDYEVMNVDIRNTPLTNVNCYSCSLSVFKIHAKTI